MNIAWCQLFFALDKIIWLYTIVLLVYAVLSWVPDLRGGWARYLDAIVDPLLRPLRRVIPPAGGFDLAFIALIAILWLLDNFVIRPLAFSCIS